MFKVGQRLRQINNLCAGESPEATVAAIKDNHIYHIHDSGCSGVWEALESDFIPLEGGDSMSKYQDLKQRIEVLKNGWDKECEEIICEMYDYKNTKTSLPLYYISMPAWNVMGDFIKISRNDREEERFNFTTQCEKMTAFKQALLWLLEHSDIAKHDERQDKIDALQKQADELCRQIKELKEG